LGYRIDSAQDRLPADIHGAGPRPARCRVAMSESSQFASALLLCAAAGGWKVDLAGDSQEEAPYVAMTRQLIAAFPGKGGEFQIEADASSASYFYAANWLMQPRAAIGVASFPKSDWQIDAAFPRFLPLPGEVSRRRQLGDSIMTAMVVAPFASGPTRFRDLERLRVQECERVAALRKELTKCGASGFSRPGRTARSGDRDLQRSSHGDVLRHPGIENKRHLHQESCLCEKNVSEFFPEAGGPFPVRPGRCHPRRAHRPPATGGGTVC